MDDLYILVADKVIEGFITGLLDNRRSDLNIKGISYQIKTYENRDPGCRRESHHVLRPMTKYYNHAIVVFDLDGCGAENKTRAEIEIEVENNLRINGWEDRAACIVIDPEVENWIWSPSMQLATTLGWNGTYAEMEEWLMSKQLIPATGRKPTDPKHAYQQIIQMTRTRKSPVVFRNLSSCLPFDGCTDQSFQKLSVRLQQWFGAAQ